MAKTFEQLKAMVQDWLVVSGESTAERLPGSVVGDILNIVRRDYLRIRESWLGERTKVVSIVANVAAYPLPGDFSKPRKLWYIATSGAVTPLNKLNKDEFDIRYPYSALLAVPGAGQLALEGGGILGLEGGGTLELSSALASLVAADIGEPEDYTIWDNNIVFGRCPSRNFPIIFDYWGLLDDLVDDVNDVLNQNRFTEHAWEYLLWAALVHSTLYGIEDDRVVVWEDQRMKMQERLDIENSRRESVGRVSQSVAPGKIYGSTKNV